jgi:hypothetical protein
MNPYRFTDWDADWVEVISRDEEPDDADSRLALIDRDHELELVEASGDQVWASVVLGDDAEREALAESLAETEVQP